MLLQKGKESKKERKKERKKEGWENEKCREYFINSSFDSKLIKTFSVVVGWLAGCFSLIIEKLIIRLNYSWLVV